MSGSLPLASKRVLVALHAGRPARPRCPGHRGSATARRSLGGRGWALAATFAQAAITWAVACWATASWGQPPPSAEPLPVAFRRIFVPQDALETQIRGLLPLKRDEFERRLSEATAGTPRGQLPAAELVRLRLRARVEGQTLRDGIAELELRWEGPHPALVVLEPWNLPLASAAWKAPSPKPAVVGRDPTGRLCCLVPQSGVLELGWQQPARATRDEPLLFELALPLAPQRQVELTVPRGWSVATSSGLISPPQPASRGEDERWAIALGGEHSVQLAVTRPGGEASRPRIWRESSRYTLYRGTFDLESTWQWEAPQPQASGSEIQFRLPQELRVAALRVGEQTAAWSLQPDPSSGQQWLSVPLPSTAEAGTLTLTASGDWPSQGFFVLPRIVPRKGVYQEGQVELFSEPWLQVQPRAARGAVRVATGATAQAGFRGLDRFAMQLFEADAQIEVAASPALAPLHVSSATQLLVETSQVLAVATAEVTVSAGERFSLDAQIPRPWVVDAVDVQPPEMLAERSVTAQGGGPQRLRLQLARPLVAGRPLRITLRAHFRRPPVGQPLAEGFFQPLGFPEARSVKRWIAVQVEDTTAELGLEEDERLRRIEEKDLAPAERQLFEQPPAGLLLATTDPAATARATLEATTARYNAELLLRVEVGRRQVQHTLLLKCTPQGAAVGSVLARLVPPPRENVAWHLVDEARELTAIPEPTATTEARHPAEVWRVPLPRPRGSPFELTAQWTSPLDGPHEVPLVGLPDATLTTALVEVHARDGHLTTQSQFLEPLPPLPPPPGQYSTLVKRFRYVAGQQPQLVIARTTPHAGDPRAWVEALQLASRLGVDGHGEHEAQFVVRNAGRDELRITLPRDVQEPSWHIQASDSAGQEAANPPPPTPATVSGNGEVVIPLPPLQAQVTVRLRYHTTHLSLARWPWRTWEVPLPSVDLPVLRRDWMIFLPPELSLWSSQGDAKGTLAAGDSPPSVPSPSSAQTFSVQGVASTNSTQDKASPAAGTAQRPGDLVRSILAGPGWLAAACKEVLALPAAPPDPLFPGWQQLTLPLPDSPRAEVCVYRVPWATAWAWAWAGAAAAWVWWRKYRFSTTLGVAFLALALATLTTTPHKWWLAGLGLGVMAGGLCASVWKKNRPGNQTSVERLSHAIHHEKRGTSTQKKQLVSTSVWWWLGWAVTLTLSLSLVGLFVWVGALAAQEGVRRTPATGRVVIPVDDQGQPAGDYVYLDPGLYERLHQRGTGEAGSLPRWLVAKARYELAELAAKEAGSEGPEVAIPHLRALLDVETFEPDTRVVLPWRQEEVTLRPGQSRLDGHPAFLSWEPDGRGLAVVVAEPGRHRLELELATRARRVGDVVQLDLSVPPAAIEEWAEGASDPQSGASAERSTPVATGQVQFVSLGAGRVRWQWPADPDRTAWTSGEAEQLLWWKIRRGSVSLEGRFRVRGLRPGAHTLLIDVDPRLRLVSGLSQGPIRRVHADSASPRVVQVDCEVPASGEVTWQVAWLWPQASGSGQLLLPKVRLSQPRLQRDWTAVSVEPPLEWVRPAVTGQPSAATKPGAAAPGVAAPSSEIRPRTDVGGAAEPLGLPTPAAFLTAWGDQEAPPLAVFATSAPELDRPLAIRPAASGPSANVELDWSVGAQAAKLVLQARLQGAAGRFDYRLTWPAPVRVQRAVLWQGGRPAALRWTQPADGTLLLTLLEPPVGDAELHIEGVLPLPAQRTRLALPTVQWEGVAIDAMHVRLYRQREVLLEMPAVPGWEAMAEGPAGSFRSERGWLVAAVRRVDERARPLQVERKSHRPKLSGHLLVRAWPDAEGWQAQALIALEVQDGFLDELRLSVPAAFSGQLRADPAWDIRVEPSTLASRRLWIVRPPVSLTGKVQWTLEGRLDPAAGGIVVPDVSLPAAPQVARWVLLEPGTPEEPIEWQPRGLVAVRPQDVPAAASVWRTEGGQWFRVVGRRFEATARLRQQKDASPRCLLAEYTVAPVAPRRCVTRSAFTLVPADTRPLVLVVPPGQRLLQVLVDGVAATAVPLAPRRWQVAAPSDVLPYQLTVLTDGQEPSASLPATAWPLPELSDLPPKQWLITLRGPWARATAGLAPWQVAMDEAQACSAEEAALVRIETLAHCLEEVLAVQSRDLPGGIVSQALRRWLAPLEQAMSAWDRDVPAEGLADRQARMESVRQLIAAVKARGGLAGPTGNDATLGQSATATVASPSLVFPPRDLDGLSQEIAGDPAVATLRLRGEASQAGALRLVLRPVAAQRSVLDTLALYDDRRVLTASLLGMALATWCVALWPRAAGWLARRSFVPLVLASAVWWLAAPWGWLGWLGLLAAAWRGWRDRAANTRPEPLSVGHPSTR